MNNKPTIFPKHLFSGNDAGDLEMRMQLGWVHFSYFSEKDGMVVSRFGTRNLMMDDVPFSVYPINDPTASKVGRTDIMTYLDWDKGVAWRCFKTKNLIDYDEAVYMDEEDDDTSEGHSQDDLFRW